METLYTVMGTGCTAVTRLHTEGTDLVAGQWADVALKRFVGFAAAKLTMVWSCMQTRRFEVGGKYDGYAPLVNRILEFFAGGRAPVARKRQ